MDSSIFFNSGYQYTNPYMTPMSNPYPYVQCMPMSYQTSNDPIAMVTAPFSSNFVSFGTPYPSTYTTMLTSTNTSNTTATGISALPQETTACAKNSSGKNQQPLGIVDKYVILSELGQDHLYPVYLASSIFDSLEDDDSKLVLKAIPATDSRGSFQNEYNIFQLKQHKNILSCIEIIKNAKFFFSDFTHKNNRPTPGDEYYNIFVLKYQPHGDFLEFVRKQRLEEGVARFFFGQVLDAVEYLHLNGYCHRDIKIENILLDENFNLVLTDFGHCVRYQDAAGVKVFRDDSSITTPGICPPEFYQGKGYKGVAMDIFALGKLLLIFMTGFNPFKCTKASDPNFNFILKGKWPAYWKLTYGWMKKRWVKSETFSKALKTLLESMLNPDPNKRVSSIQKIRESAWFKKTAPATQEEVKMAMIRAKAQA